MTDSKDWAALPHGASLFGKLPSKRDFVRIHHDYPAALAFDRWLERSLADLAQHGLKYGNLHLRFLFAQPDVSLVGVLLPSRDGAGREHPVSVFAAVPTRAVEEDAAAVWLASQGFMTAAEELLGGASTLADVTCALRALVLVSREDYARARERVAVVSCERSAISMRRSDGSAFHVQVHPASSVSDSLFWCASASRAREGVPGPRSLFWSGPGENARIALCLGELDMSVLRRFA